MSTCAVRDYRSVVSREATMLLAEMFVDIWGILYLFRDLPSWLGTGPGAATAAANPQSGKVSHQASAPMTPRLTARIGKKSVTAPQSLLTSSTLVPCILTRGCHWHGYALAKAALSLHRGPSSGCHPFPAFKIRLANAGLPDMKEQGFRDRDAMPRFARLPPHLM